MDDLCIPSSTSAAQRRAERPRFWRSLGPEPHSVRIKAILAAHPQVRALMGRNPWTAAIATALVAGQSAIAAFFGRAPNHDWPFLLATAWLVGAFANHCLYVIIHEATHDLIFRRRSLNKAIGILADLTNVAPGAIAFRAYHLKHHSHLGDPAHDADLPSEWEERLFGRSAFGKACWLFLFPLVQVLRLLRVGADNLHDRWFVANALANAAFALAMLFLFGWKAPLYLFASFWFSIGLHPLGARWIQEHFTLDPAQETSSYYGPLNRFALNMGYHNEHHDLPSVPWNRLPELKKTAPEFYESLTPCASWPRLAWRFIFDPNYSFASRIARD